MTPRMNRECWQRRRVLRWCFTCLNGGLAHAYCRFSPYLQLNTVNRIVWPPGCPPSIHHSFPTCACRMPCRTPSVVASLSTPALTVFRDCSRLLSPAFRGARDPSWLGGRVASLARYFSSSPRILRFSAANLSATIYVSQVAAREL